MKIEQTPNPKYDNQIMHYCVTLFNVYGGVEDYGYYARYNDTFFSSNNFKKNGTKVIQDAVKNDSIPVIEIAIQLTNDRIVTYRILKLVKNKKKKYRIVKTYFIGTVD